MNPNVENKVCYGDQSKNSHQGTIYLQLPYWLTMIYNQFCQLYQFQFYRSIFFAKSDHSLVPSVMNQPQFIWKVIYKMQQMTQGINDNIVGCINGNQI